MTIKNIVQKQFQLATKVIDEENRIVRFTISTESIDRDGDIVRQAGLDFGNYKKNPIVLYNHSRDKELGNGEEWIVESTSTSMDVKFAPEGISQFIDEKYNLVKCGVLRTGSIGFIPKDYGWINIDGREVFEYERVEVIEFSVCTIPSNPDATSSSKSFRETVKIPEPDISDDIESFEIKDLEEYIEIEKLK